MNTQSVHNWEFFDHESSDAWQARLQQPPSYAAGKTAWRSYRFLPLWLTIVFITLLLWARSWPSSEVVSQPGDGLSTQPTVQQSATTSTASEPNQWVHVPEAIGGGAIHVENLGTHPGDDLERHPSTVSANRSCTHFCSCANYHLPNCMAPKALTVADSVK